MQFDVKFKVQISRVPCHFKEIFKISLNTVQNSDGLGEETVAQSGGSCPDALQPPTRRQEFEKGVGKVGGVSHYVGGFSDTSVCVYVRYGWKRHLWPAGTCSQQLYSSRTR